MRESRIRTRIIQFLNSLPQSRFEVSPPGSVPGKPDITGCLAGRYIACEVKRPGQSPTRLQRWTLRKLKDAGAVAFVACSVEEVKVHLRELM